jgi:hypothetical protein
VEYQALPDDPEGPGRTTSDALAAGAALTALLVAGWAIAELLSGQSDFVAVIVIATIAFFGTAYTAVSLLRRRPVVAPPASAAAPAFLALSREPSADAMAIRCGIARTSRSACPGCCSSPGGTLKATPDCTGLNDTSTVYIRVDLSAKNECVNYSIDYHY